MSSLHGVETAEKLLIYNKELQLIAVAEAVAPEKRQVRVRGYGAFSLAHGGELCGGTRQARRGTAAEITNAEATLRLRDDEKQKGEDAARQAAYDALPEAVKLARKLDFFCNVNGEKTVSKMPIDVLRAAVAWIEANKLECE